MFARGLPFSYRYHPLNRQFTASPSSPFGGRENFRCYLSTMDLKTVVDRLRNDIPLKLAGSWDNVGLLTGIFIIKRNSISPQIASIHVILQFLAVCVNNFAISY